MMYKLIIRKLLCRNKIETLKKLELKSANLFLAVLYPKPVPFVLFDLLKNLVRTNKK